MSLVALGMALIDAVKSGDQVTVANLLDAGADPDTVDLFDGLPALEHALRAGHADVARLLRPAPSERAPRPEAAPPVSANGAVHANPPGQPSWVNPLMACYFTSGYVRRPARSAEAELGDEAWEVVFLCSGKQDVRHVQKLLAEGGFAFREVQRKNRSRVVVAPGREAVERVLGLWAKVRQWPPYRSAGPSPPPYVALLQRVRAGTAEAVYKLRRRSDGLFCDGGEGWSARGRSWGRLADVQAHLSRFAREPIYGGVTWDELEVVVFEVRTQLVDTLALSRRGTSVTVKEPAS
jgi:hypothetical protein